MGDSDGSQQEPRRPVSRRQYLALGGFATIGTLAGCALLDDGSDGDGGAGESTGDGTPNSDGTDHRTESAGGATVELDGDDRGDWTVPDTLFGRFAEHYGSNEIEPGIYAEHVTNVAFVEYCFFQGGSDVTHYYSPEDVGEFDGVPFPWHPVGDAELERPAVGGVRGYEDWTLDANHWPVVDEESGNAFQRIAVDGAAGGVGQQLLLPDWRTLTYEASLSARTRPAASGAIDELELRLRAPDGGALASATIEGIADEWARFEDVKLELADQSGVKHDITDPLAHLDVSAYGEYVLEIVVEGTGEVDVDWVSLVPGDAVDGPRTGAPFNPTTIALMDDRNTTLLKWPGGNYTSTYPWENGVGPVERRPIWPNVIWDGLDPNLLGTAEYVDFCELTGVEPTITVGVTVPLEDGGRGFQPPRAVTPEDAANWVEYCNGDADTEYGALRAEHGYEEPFDVDVWEVGNEVWAPWQAGGTDDPGTFAERAAAFATAMRAVDDSITVIPDGMDPKYDDPNLVPDPEDWNRTVFETLGEDMDAIGMHRYNWGIREDAMREQWREENDADAIDYNEVLVSFPTQFDALLQETANLAAEAGLDEMEIMVGEWGLFPSVDFGDPWPGMETMAGASFIAGMYNAFVRRSEHLRRGCHTHLPTRMFPPSVDPNIPVGFTKRLYATVFEGDREWEVLDASVEGATRDLPETGYRIRAMDDVHYVDAATVATPEDDALCTFLTNRNLRSGSEVTVELPEGFHGGTAEVTVQRPTGDPHAIKGTLGDYPDAWFQWTDLQVYEIDESEAAVEDGAVAVDLDPTAVARIVVE